MGDPLSPAMTILTCAWMEKEWMTSLQPIDRMFFRGARYMDDILLFTSKAEDWDSEKFLAHLLKSECYWKPLKLEEVQADKFLETTIERIDGSLAFRLKNENETSNKVWRYHDYRSRLDYTTKRATISASLKRVDHNASNATQLRISAMAKCKEWISLGYPPGILQHLCATIAFTTKNDNWNR